MADTTPTLEGKVTSLGIKSIKADTAALVTNGTASFPDDAFAGQYATAGDPNTANSVITLEPVHKPGTLIALASQNNILEQCIAAMEINIDGTGFAIEPVDSEVVDEGEKQILEDFFKEPYPGKTFTQLRRLARRDSEATGDGFYEVIRDAEDEVVMLNYLSAVHVRMVKLDAPVVVDRIINRAGKELKTRVRVRERRFVQMVNGKKVYFTEFNASRHVNRLTGEWAEKKKLPIEERGSEVIHLTINKEAKTPYGTPRWINQLPSVLGSRKAEEVNLEFFDSGGIPPLLVMVQGGTMGAEVKNELKKHFSGSAKESARAAIVEVTSTSGTLDSAGAVQVKLERFGGERQSDSLFQGYDKNTEAHVRCGFRLPPMFLGKAEDLNFATAKTAYMVAEAQVFAPEREEFDAMINNTIVPALGVTKYRLRSLPVTLVDVEQQLVAVEMAATAQSVKGEELVDTLNEVVGLSMEGTEPPEVVPPTEGVTAVAPTEVPTKEEVAKSSNISALVGQWATLIGLEESETITTTDAELIIKQVEELPIEDKLRFDTLLAQRTLVKSEVDIAGLSELCGCADHLVLEAEESDG